MHLLCAYSVWISAMFFIVEIALRYYFKGYQLVMCILIDFLLHLLAGPRLNIKTVLSTYGNFHVKDKTAVRTSYL